jgi:hypothetical protein
MGHWASPGKDGGFGGDRDLDHASELISPVSLGGPRGIKYFVSPVEHGPSKKNTKYTQNIMLD